MNMLDEILNANNGSIVRQLGSQFGLSDDRASAALGSLVPALAAGMQQNAQSAGGLGSLLGALAGGDHAKYVDDPSTLGDPRAVEDGNGILGHVFGSKDVSRQVASRVAAQTGIGEDVLKRMLPMVAAAAMGALARRSSTSLVPGTNPMSGGGLMSMLGATLDRNHDGSMVDDLMGMLGKFRT